jgi:hypothetical protein
MSIQRKINISVFDSKIRSSDRKMLIDRNPRIGVIQFFRCSEWTSEFIDFAGCSAQFDEKMAEWFSKLTRIYSDNSTSLINNYMPYFHGVELILNGIYILPVFDVSNLKVLSVLNSVINENVALAISAAPRLESLLLLSGSIVSDASARHILNLRQNLKKFVMVYCNAFSDETIQRIPRLFQQTIVREVRFHEDIRLDVELTRLNALANSNLYAICLSVFVHNFKHHHLPVELLRMLFRALF